MTHQTIQKNPIELSQIKRLLDNPEFYLQNLEEYRKMLELLSLNEHLSELLSADDIQHS